jgi:hypothetical protein
MSMMGMLKSLGIKSGKPFAPDDKTKKAMRQTAIDARFFLQAWFDNIPKDRPYWPERHHALLLMADKNRTFTFVSDDCVDLIDRAAEYFWCNYIPKALSEAPATHYLMAMAMVMVMVMVMVMGTCSRQASFTSWTPRADAG